ncbi:MAG: RluA family pseudouridine synthase [Alphaproteobacteria bacterium]
MNENYITIFISSNDLGKRVDYILSNKLQNFSRRRIQSFIIEGHLTYNDIQIIQPSFKLRHCGAYKLNIPEPTRYEILPQKIELNIVYEDEHLIVINKEPGIVVHPGAGNATNTIVNALLFHCKNNLSGIGGVMRPGVVHRIDKMTSGLIVFAKDDITHNSLSTQFQKKSTFREYNLISWNLLTTNEGEIRTRLIRSRLNRKKMTVTNKENGKLAITRFQLVKSFVINDEIKISHIKCKLLTGRTHQIRVHMSHINNPIIGDTTYSRNKYVLKLPLDLQKYVKKHFITPERQALHARLLGFLHPHKKIEMQFESNLPDDINDLLNKLAKKL